MTKVDRERARTLDYVARRYGRLPSEIRERSIDDLMFDLFVASVGEAETQERR